MNTLRRILSPSWFLIFVMSFSAGCASYPQPLPISFGTPPMNTFIAINEQLPPLTDPAAAALPAALRSYLDYYQLDSKTGPGKVRHDCGVFDSQGRRLIGHIFQPPAYRGAVVLLHGYCNHVGQLNRLIDFLLAHDYAVAAFDLPGHGLSEGPPAAIDDFAAYSQALRDFTHIVQQRLEPPLHLIAHSTGGAAAIDYLLTHGGNPFEQIILAAPLVHCVAWEWTKLSRYSLVPNDTVPRVFHKTSADKKFMAFIQKDPLQPRQIPLCWVRALHQWNEKLAALPECGYPITILQGTDDQTVDWRYNLPVLQDKFTQTHVIYFQRTNHDLFNESEALRRPVFAEIGKILER